MTRRLGVPDDVIARWMSNARGNQAVYMRDALFGSSTWSIGPALRRWLLRAAPVTASLWVICLGAAVSQAQDVRSESSATAPVVATQAAAPPSVPATEAPPIVPPTSRDDALTVGRIERMDAWLASLDRTQRVARLAGGIGTVVLGGLDVAGGVIVTFQNSSGSRHWERPALAIVMVGTGAGMLASAIGELAHPSTQEVRYARWQAFPQIDALTLAHFEGELAAEATGAHQRRMLDGMSNLGVAAGSAIMLGLTPLSKIEGSARTASYGLATTGLVIGVWQAIVKFVVESEDERAYRMYQAGSTPDHAKNHLQLTPAFAAQSGSLTFSGTF